MHSEPAVITHLIGPDTPALRGDVLHTLCAQPTPRQRIVSWGRAPAWTARQDIGAGHGAETRLRTVHAPFGATWLGRRACEALLAEVGNGVLHVWSAAALRWVAASLARAGCAVIVDVELPASLARLARAIGRPWRDGTLRFACPTDAARRRLIATGARTDDCVLIRDSADFARINAARTEGPRDVLGLDVSDFVVLALPPALRATGTFAATWGVLLLAQIHRKTRLIIPGQGREVERVRRLVAACRQEWLLRTPGARLDLYALLAAADVAVYLPPAAAPLAGVVAAMAAGTPVVASATTLTTELLRHGHNAWLVGSDRPRDICRRILDAMENREQTRRQAELARMQAYKVFGRRRMVEQYTRLWKNVCAGRPAGAGIDDPARIRAGALST